MKSMLSYSMILVVAVFATILCRTTMAIPPSIISDSPHHEFNQNICKSMVLEDITSLLSQYKSVANSVLPIYVHAVSHAYETATFPDDWEASDEVKSFLRGAVLKLKDEVIARIGGRFEKGLDLILNKAKAQFFEAVSLFFGVGKPTALTTNEVLAKTIIMHDLMEVKNKLDVKFMGYLLESFPEWALLYSMERVVYYNWLSDAKGVKSMTNKFKEEFEGSMQSAIMEVQALNVKSSLPTLQGAYFEALPNGNAVSDM